jgi:uncharacterized protein (DUF2336 family)
MTTGASAALIAELEDALARCARHRRASVINEVIRLFLEQPERNVRHLGSFDQVLACLIRQAEVSDLASLSNAIVRSQLELPEATRQLASHEEASIAVPVLRHSNSLSDETLVELAETRNQDKLLAISSRAALSEPLTTALVLRGNTAVHVAISRNLGARLTEGSFAILLKIAERDQQLAGALAKRADIPPPLLRKFLALVTEQSRVAFLNSASPEIRAMSQRETPSKAKVQRDYSAAEKEIGVLSRTGKLTDSTVNRFAVGQDHERLIAALAFLSEAPITTIERLLDGDRADELAIACKAARLRWATAASILRHCQGGPPISEQQLEKQRVLFERFSLSEAQQTIRLGKTDLNAGGSATNALATIVKRR